MLLATPAYANPAPTPDTLELSAGSGLANIVVPDGVCAVNVTIGGGRGGLAIGEETPPVDPDDDPIPGDETGTRGSGAQISASLDLQAGHQLTVNVGGDGANNGIGGLNGGGDGGTGGHRGGGGGGYTSVSFDGADLLLAGGGGGTGGGHNDGYGFGGDAGFGQNTSEGVADGTVYAADAGVAGWDGLDVDDLDILPGAGNGGTAIAGGAGGIHPTDGLLNGADGSAFQGGNGGEDPSLDTGGGGGSGYFGGGGGASTIGAGAYTGGGGGGGSSFVSDSALLSNVVLENNRFPEGDANEGLAASAFATLEWVMCDYNLTVTKGVVGNPVFEDGGVVSYFVTITNDGPDDMAIGDTVTLVDDLAAGGTLISVDGLDTSIPEAGDEIPAGGIELFDTVDLNTDPDEGPNEVKRGLATGDSVTVYYDVVVTGDAPVTNTVSVSDRNGVATDLAVVDPAAPSLALVKSANTGRVTHVGQKVTYSFLVTNTGNIDLHNVSIEEGEFSGAGTLPTPTCPTAPVAPGNTVTCTSVYTAVAGDLTGSDLVNSAVAHAETPMGFSVESGESEVELVTVKPLPVTGGPTAAMLGIGALVLLGGGAVALAGRRITARLKA